MLRNSPYDKLMMMDVKKSYKPLKTKKHHETCPTCGRTLVNIYYSNGIWKCNECWEKVNRMIDLLGLKTDTCLPFPKRKE